MKGFTLIELVISIAIFAVMTALVIAKYGSFNQDTLVTNMAYDLAITVRTAQSYGVSVKSVTGDSYNAAYGIHFDLSKSNTAFTFFVDKNKDGIYNPSTGGDTDITTYNLTQGAKISSICLSSDYNPTCTGVVPVSSTFDVTYRRPNPDSNFDINGSLTLDTTDPVATINIVSSNGSNLQSVVIRRNGQISVGN